MARIVFTSVLACGFVIGSWFLWHSLKGDAEPEVNGFLANGQPPEGGIADCDHPVNALGHLVPRRGVISVSATPGDQLALLHVMEGTVVTKNQMLAELNSKSLRELEWKARESQEAEAAQRLKAELAAADKRIQAAELGQEKVALQEIEEAAQRAQIAFLGANLQIAQRNLDRLRGVSESLVSAQKREQQQLLVEKTAAELKAAQATLDRLIASREYAAKAALAELAVAEAGKNQIVAAGAQDSLGLARQIAKMHYDQTTLLAPSEGTVLKIFVQPGESLGPQPILQMADLKHMICQAEVFEMDVQCVKEGQRVRVTSPAFPAPFNSEGVEGRVERISRLIASPKLESLDPYAPVDRHVVEVRIGFDEQASQVAGRFVNLQVQVEFLVDQADQ